MFSQDRKAKENRIGGRSTGRSFFSAVPVQAKLKINEPNDKYEQEADRVADEVVRTPESPIGKIVPPSIQRKCEACEDEELNRKENSEETPTPSPDLEAHIGTLTGGGRPMNGEEKSFFEPRFNRDFSSVRIHENDPSAENINARAYTTGNHIVFNPSESPNNKRLMAHELTHVVQQGGGRGSAGNWVQRDEEASTLERASTALLNEVLPVGTGFFFEVNGGITWGYPIYTGGSAILNVNRQTETVIQIRVRKQGRLAFDTGVGASVMIGRGGRSRGEGSGSGRGVGLGAEAGANAMLGVQGTVIEEYSVPVSDFLGFVGSQTLENILSQSSFGAVSAPITRMLEINSERYLVTQRVEGGIFARADAEASAGIRRPTDHFNENSTELGPNELRGGGSTWGPNDSERSFQGTRPDLLRGDPLALLNFLRLFVGANVSAGVTLGTEQRTRGNTTVTSFFVEGQIGAMLGLPIPIINNILQSLPLDGGGGIEIRIEQQEGGDVRMLGILYTKQGEDQYYAGSANQQNIVINLSNLISFEELIQSLRSGNIPSLTSAVNFRDLLEKVSFFNRLALHSSPTAGFAALLRRQQGTRSLLSTAAVNKARRVFSGGMSVYFDFGAEIPGPNFLSIAREIIQVGSQAVSSLESATDLSSAYQALSGYFSGYARSESFQELQDNILSSALVTDAKIRLEVGVGAGVAARVAEGAKARFDLSGEVGLSCEFDLMVHIGDRANLRALINGVNEILEEPQTYFPNCPIVNMLFSGQGGGTGDQIGNGEHDQGQRTGTEQGQNGRNANTSSSGSENEDVSTPGGSITINNEYPEGLRSVTFNIPNTSISWQRMLRLRRGTEINDMRFLIQTERQDGNLISVWVPVRVRVMENRNGNVVFEVTRPWYIPEYQIGSNIGETYRFRISSR